MYRATFSWPRHYLEVSGKLEETTPKTRERTGQGSEDGENVQICCNFTLKGLFGHSVLYIADVPYKLQHSIIFMDFEYRKGRFDMRGFN
jgi:hypothetical protein